METTIRPLSTPAGGLPRVPAPFNPYLRPAGGSPEAQARWALRALAYSLTATLIWDRGSIRPDMLGFKAAPAQWVSALVLTATAVATAVAVGLPWGALWLLAGAVVAVRRLLASKGATLTWRAALAKSGRKIVLATTGLILISIAQALGTWITATVAATVVGPAAMLIGQSGMAGLNGQVDVAVQGITNAGNLACAGLMALAVLSWAVGAYRAQSVLTTREAGSNV